MEPFKKIKVSRDEAWATFIETEKKLVKILLDNYLYRSGCAVTTNGLSMYFKVSKGGFDFSFRVSDHANGNGSFGIHHLSNECYQLNCSSLDTDEINQMLVFFGDADKKEIRIAQLKRDIKFYESKNNKKDVKILNKQLLKLV